MAERTETADEVRANAWAEYHVYRRKLLKDLILSYLKAFAGGLMACIVCIVGLAAFCYVAKLVIDFVEFFYSLYGLTAVLVLGVGVVVLLIAAGFAVSENSSAWRGFKYKLSDRRDRIERGRFDHR